MLHVYRQATTLSQVQATAIAFKRENADRFPYESVNLIPRTSLRWFRRWWMIQVRKRPPLAYPSETGALNEALRDCGARLLHIYFGNNGVFWLPFLRQSRVPTIVSFHGADVQVGFKSEQSRRLLREVFSRSARILARSESLADTLRANGCPPEKISIQRTGIPLDQYPYVKRIVPPNGQWRLLQACRLVEKKGLEATLRGFAGFGEHHPEAMLIIAGDGPLKERLEQLAISLGMSKRIIFTGFLTPAKLRELYYQSHLFLHPSETTPDGNREGVPNSLLEAMATGLPSIATNHGGIPEAVEHWKSGLLVPESDPDAISAALEQLTADPQLAASLGKNGANTVRDKFDLAIQVKHLEGIYLEILGAG
jgi:colanic acid/amylovoran biosynthesis glycosyltransferase